MIVGDSTTVNLYKLCAAVLEAREGAIVTDRGNFPTDRYVLEGLAARSGRELRLVDTPEQAARGGRRARRALARRLPLRRDRRHGRAHRRHRRTWSGTSRTPPARSRSTSTRPASSSPSAAPTSTSTAAPARPPTSTSRRSARPQLRSPIWGWFGQRDQFAMERDYDPVDGIGRFQAGTPPILALAAVEEGVKLTAEAGIAAIRAKSTSPHRADRRAPRRLARAARLRPRLTARPGAARLPRLRHPPAGVADQRRADRARERRPRLPRPRRDPPRRRAALHEPRRRLGRARPPARRSSSAASTSSSTRPAAGSPERRSRARARTSRSTRRRSTSRQEGTGKGSHLAAGEAARPAC